MEVFETAKRVEKYLGIPSLKNFIIAGVLILNLKKIEKRGLSKDLENEGYHNGIQCTTADLYLKADLKLDIQATELPDESFD